MPKQPLTNEQAFALFPKIIDFITRYGIMPNIKSIDPQEKQLAEAIKIIKQQLKITMSKINTLVPATIQVKLKVKCNCKYCNDNHYDTITFKLQIEKKDDYSEGRKSNPDYPHQCWTVRYVPDSSFYTLTDRPKWADHQDLATAMLEAAKELDQFINRNESI